MTSQDTDQQLRKDIELIAQIDAIPAILDVICKTTGMGFAAVARVTKERWIAGQVLDKVGFGLAAGGELAVDTTICDEIRDSGKMVIFDNAAEDPAFCDHHTPRIYGLKSYISVPIYRKGTEFFGTLCAIDANPAKVNTPEIIATFQLFAELIGKHIDAREREAASDMQLLLEREVATLRDQFIAILGHDLRNPLNSISVGTRLLKDGISPDKLPTIMRMERSIQRMESLIANTLDFSRARLGGGFELDRRIEHHLHDHLSQVISELSAAWPGKHIHTGMALSSPINCDSARISQMFSNVLSNALTHGARDSDVDCLIEGDDRRLHIEIRNAGEPIAPDVMRRLFQPFSRGGDRAGKNSLGLGLGLYIASEIARAHGGVLTATSDPGVTSFVFEMPNAPGTAPA
ncbi:GAF domain-containing sensor histidine kinase [Herbaspirillum sp. WKF16]|uniref:GAF domain-containing sensor histidine kinase n=1 Tax=Herbaspirillum sp. WKF16 TaxID=3028312 RepID=UPI0023A9EC62|nr:GAF domain-containing sensor histidine kinase [Herbaspirillum sp. WKF16]WDZ94110.1 GAF domain-containing sensor histidine kinase [Herbaspirillum sp. WKF16]